MELVIESAREASESLILQDVSRRVVVFSGGTAFNDIASDLTHYFDHVSYVLPVSDDGGSTAEIVRVIGGAAVGDIRSRCLRLAKHETPEEKAVYGLLGHRLSADTEEAKMEWLHIVEGEHDLWNGISTPFKHTIRSFLVHFMNKVLQSNKRFNYSNGSIGNFFFAGARTFFQSIEAAIFLFSRVSRIPNQSYILPVIVDDCDSRVALGCELEDGQVIRGQNNISHPPHIEEKSIMKATMTTTVSKDAQIPLPSKIKRVFYLPTEGDHLNTEIYPNVNETVIQHIQQASKIVYGMGSLFTSIAPSLVLQGVGEAIAAYEGPKILLLNGSHDRETFNMKASDMVRAITNALNRKYFRFPKAEESKPYSYVTILAYPKLTNIEVDKETIQKMGITLVPLDSELDHKERPIFSSRSLCRFLDL